jgi:hypothetical protein
MAALATSIYRNSDQVLARTCARRAVEPLYLTVTETFSRDHVMRTMTLNGKTIFFKTIAEPLPPPLQSWDFAVLAGIFTAMRLGRPLHVQGPVSRTLLRNLEEFQEAWAVWLPDLYQVVEVVADREVELRPATEGAGVFAFSGGIDSTFSLLRHVRKKAGRRTIRPVAAVLIKGFDIPLRHQQAFTIAHSSARTMLQELGVRLAVVESNWKADLCYNWDMEHATGLAACLNQFAGLADVAVLGGDEGYDKIETPWGSNVITNPLLSTASLSLRTEASGFTRSERLAFVVANSNLAPYLRVCWENAHTGTNCGVCEKCIRTQLNFRAIGAQPEGFLRTAGLLRIATIPQKSVGDDYWLHEAQRAASQRGIHGAWRAASRIAFAKYIMLFPFILAKEKLIRIIRRDEGIYFRVKRMVKRHA